MSLTPNDASVLCVITTNNSGGSHLIATINVTLQHTLADVRSVLVSLARGEGGGPKAVVEEPVNVSDVELKKQILSAPLHPFDLTECFYFVRAGGCRVVKEGLETRLTVGECIPRYPRFGVPREPAWCLSPPAPTVIVPRHPTARRTPKGKKLGHKYDNKHTGEKRTGVVWLQIAQGIVNRPYMVTAERVLAERLLLQQKFLYHRDGGSGYGQLFSVQSFGSSITKWNANVVDFLGRTLLHEVCQIGNEQAARFLLSKNYVVVEARDRSGNTPLHLAVQSCQGACVKLLLEHGADPLTPNDSTGDTPLHLALLRGEARGGHGGTALCPPTREWRGGRSGASLHPESQWL
ncbi:Ankyrin repeats (3 copies)/Ankyrin repeats (many copies)/Ankyrin repeat, putative [Angomonas deanei]|uniref:Ankyrin repeats (3 copies)/Ankyrin repeats (Many copies)/Ankyrin repeat, putative n=1 Tax=Angomonas deanei TaxID=59799 RepID=A0A7G2CAG3_9TRYP|nr:Ankyrin repeats (3 copies)/Ankyrin repeats (many copies)/Ankyrin repeat, putative [Angomonas deanei]